MNQGKLLTASFDWLQAFWPALQVLVGDIGEAAQTHSAFHALWQRFKVLPERYDVHRAALHGSMVGYPLRPELAESCYALYQATGEAQYLRMGAEMVASLNAHARTKHGFASIRSVVDMRVDDHMTSFFLAETLKYLYLLFDDDNWLNAHSDAYVLTTEAHLIPLSTAAIVGRRSFGVRRSIATTRTAGASARVSLVAEKPATARCAACTPRSWLSLT